MKRLAVALLVLATGVGVGGELVSADAPVKQGWWSRLQVDPATSPLPPAVPVTPTLPAPPTGDDGGLTVAHGPDGPTAIAAMYFTVQAPVDGTLYLEAAPKQKPGTGPSTSTTIDDAPHPDSIVLPPEAVVLACSALSAWDGEVNGPWSKVPTWDAGNCVPGTVTSGKTAMFWTLKASMQDLDDNYDIVLVPTGPPPPPPEGAEAPPAQTTYMVNFASPGADTLVTEALPEEEPTTTTTTEPEVDPPPTGPGLGGFSVPPPGGFTTPTAALRTTPTSLVALRRPPATVRRTSLRLPDTRRERIMAVSMLLAMAGALWWLGGSPTRGPRLIGAVAGRRPGQAAAAGPLLRGVGRFARPRGGRIPRL